jgi:pimeloyl-ACP methyl ester carboxylesterase
LAVRSIVLLSGYYRSSLRADVPLFAPPAIPVVGDLMRFTVSPLITRLLWPGLMRKLFGPNDIPRHFEHFPKWMALRPGQIRASAAETALMVPEAARLGRSYARLSVPAVIVAGEGDLIVNTAWQAENLQKRLPGSRLHIVPGVGHMVHHIAPKAVLEAIDEAAEMGAERLRSSGRPQLTTA